VGWLGDEPAYGIIQVRPGKELKRNFVVGVVPDADLPGSKAARRDLMIEMVLSRIVTSDKRETQLIWLKEREGERSFAILIGPCEARAIEYHIKKFPTPRPLTHDLLASVITELNCQLERIEITELKNGIYFARLIIRQDGEVVEVDSRPSDAIALALRHNSPIFCAEKVIEEAAQFP